MKRKSIRDRKSVLVNFRISSDERKRLGDLSQATGLSYSGIFRLAIAGDVLDAPSAIAQPADDIRSAIAEYEAIHRREDISEAQKDALWHKATLKRRAAKRAAHEAALKAYEREMERQYGKHSA